MLIISQSTEYEMWSIWIGGIPIPFILILIHMSHSFLHSTSQLVESSIEIEHSGEVLSSRYMGKHSTLLEILDMARSWIHSTIILVMDLMSDSFLLEPTSLVGSWQISIPIPKKHSKCKTNSKSRQDLESTGEPFRSLTTLKMILLLISPLPKKTRDTKISTSVSDRMEPNGTYKINANFCIYQK